MIQHFMSQQFLVFLLTGGLAAAVNFISRIILNYWLDFSISIILAYLIGMVTAFCLAKIFVFKESKQSLHQSAVIFALVNLLAIFQTWAVSMLLANFVLPRMGIIQFGKEIAHGIGIIIPVFTSYIGHKKYSFR